jgi:hypothetical protein
MPKTDRRIPLLLIGYMIFATGCSAIQLPGDSGAILFQDTFVSTQSGWDRYHDDTYRADYTQNAYRINVLDPIVAWSLPRLNFANAIIDVKAKKIDGPDDNVYGLICRYQDPENFYFFLISSDGFAGIGVYRDGIRTLLSGDSMLPSDLILEGNAMNSIHVECVDDQLSMSVNGELLYEIQSAGFRSGDVGLIAGSYSEPGVEIEFDDFSVTNP